MPEEYEQSWACVNIKGRALGPFHESVTMDAQRIVLPGYKLMLEIPAFT